MQGGFEDLSDNPNELSYSLRRDQRANVNPLHIKTLPDYRIIYTYVGIWLKWSPMGRKSVAAIERWLL